MITLLVGHRGTGKTSLLSRLARRHPGVPCLDLDARIAAATGAAIDTLFAARGEAAFRALERHHLDALARELGGREAYVALGAGFLGPLPAGTRRLWVRRDTDAAGRIFLDRPRLDPSLDPLEEYHARFAAREARYRGWADRVLTLGEGFEEDDPAEVRYFAGAAAATEAAITVLPEHLAARPGGADAPDARRLAAWAADLRALGVTRFEVRDDLLGPQERAAVLATLDRGLVIFSRRRPGAAEHGRPPPGCALDHDLSLGPVPAGGATILSLHDRHAGESVTGAAQRLDAAAPPGAHRKLAVAIAGLAELLEGHAWVARDPAGRSFLPRSSDGRWAWYRLLRAAETRLNFVREGRGSAADQPTLLQWLRFVPGDGAFAAVLGDPVIHSRTPAAHHAFFAARGRPVLAVRLVEADRTAASFDRLARLGLRHAAVTAPLKSLARTACAVVTETARAFDAVNTLAFDERGHCWHGTNTDRDGFEALRPAGAGARAVAVWGGGGTRAMLADVYPGAALHAARTGAHTGGPVVAAPEIVVWAAGRTQAAPPAAWRPARVIDLDYRDDAPGRAYALRAGARYTSGLAMFERQAAAQRAWWASLEASEC